MTSGSAPTASHTCSNAVSGRSRHGSGCASDAADTAPDVVSTTCTLLTGWRDEFGERGGAGDGERRVAAGGARQRVTPASRRVSGACGGTEAGCVAPGAARAGTGRPGLRQSVV